MLKRYRRSATPMKLGLDALGLGVSIGNTPVVGGTPIGVGAINSPLPDLSGSGSITYGVSGSVSSILPSLSGTATIANEPIPLSYDPTVGETDVPTSKGTYTVIFNQDIVFDITGSNRFQFRRRSDAASMEIFQADDATTATGSVGGSASISGGTLAIVLGYVPVAGVEYAIRINNDVVKSNASGVFYTDGDNVNTWYFTMEAGAKTASGAITTLVPTISGTAPVAGLVSATGAIQTPTPDLSGSGTGGPAGSGEFVLVVPPITTS